MKTSENYKLKQPILLIFFNRFDHVKKVFEQIKELKPPRLYLSSDGPRLEKSEDHITVEKIRKYFEQNVDWECQVIKKYSNLNKGCKLAVSEAITWFFKYEQEGIILEDDCVPSLSFFRYCDELLQKYRHDKRISLITGFNYVEGFKRNDDSYWFSRSTPIWGWASWSDRWKYYDVKMQNWEIIRDQGWVKDMISNSVDYKEIINGFDAVQRGDVDTWDAQWTFACLTQNMVSIVPAVNLITNIGFDKDATHTKSDNKYLGNTKQNELIFPLKHPKWIIPNVLYDIKLEEITRKRELNIIQFILSPLKLVCKKIIGIKVYNIIKEKYHKNEIFKTK